MHVVRGKVSDAVSQLAAKELLDGTTGFIEHIYSWTSVNEYWLTGGHGPRAQDFFADDSGLDVDMNYTQVMYAMCKSHGNRYTAAAKYSLWAQFASVMDGILGTDGSHNPLMQYLDYLPHTANHRGAQLGITAAEYPSFSRFRHDYLADRFRIRSAGVSRVR